MEAHIDDCRLLVNEKQTKQSIPKICVAYNDYCILAETVFLKSA